jgi:hypothetical protein
MNNKSSIAEEPHQQLEQLLRMIEARVKQGDSTADQMERDLFVGVIQLGKQLLQLYFDLHNQHEERQPHDENGERYKVIEPHSRKYRSVFGEVAVKRWYYWKPGGGTTPLDAELSLPGVIYSDWVQELLTRRATDTPYEKALEQVQELLPIEMAKQTLEQLVEGHAQDVVPYYAQVPAPKPAEGDTILVATADGKGIPMTAQDSPPTSHRRDKSRKTGKKIATVVGTYTVAPYNRDTEHLIASLLGADGLSVDSPSRPPPHHKHIFATLEGQETAFTHLKQAIEQRDGDHILHRVALTDGDHGLHNQVATQLPGFTLIVDIMHVLDYLWDAAAVFFPPENPLRLLWMEHALRCLLEDKLESLCHFLQVQCQASCFSSSQRQTLGRTLTYLQNNRDAMHYQSYLALGFPIATGIVEGTCRYFVRDRFERSGMRWSYKGAEALLQLRAVALNEDWLDFQDFRRQQQHLRLYASSHPALFPEAHVWTLIA